MTATETRRPGPRPPAPLPPLADAPAGADLTPVVAALARIVQAALYGTAGDIGRGDISPNATLVRLGAAREDVEALRAFLAAQPRPGHLPPQEET